MAAASEFASMRLSTDDVPERERLPVLREVFSPIVRLDFEPMTDAPPHWSMATRVLPDLVVSTVTCSAARGRRTPALIADGNDSCLFSMLRAPGNTVAYRGREPLPGGTTLLSLADAFVCTAPAGAHGVTITVPRKVLAATVPRFEDSFGHHLSPRSEALQLLTSYVELVVRDFSLGAPEVRQLAVTHVHDLLALAIGASRDAAEIANGRGLRAARQHVTPRYVQALFEGEGTTFSQFVLGERLVRVYRMLRDPRHAGRSISSIVYDAGFGDLSHFNRAFRRRYGGTPSDVRAAAQRELDR
jgi:AraC-like DNA-binding protein